MQGNALEGEVDTWEFAASGAYFGRKLNWWRYRRETP